MIRKNFMKNETEVGFFVGFFCTSIVFILLAILIAVVYSP